GTATGCRGNLEWHRSCAVAGTGRALAAAFASRIRWRHRLAGLVLLSPLSTEHEDQVFQRQGTAADSGTGVAGALCARQTPGFPAALVPHPADGGQSAVMAAGALDAGALADRSPRTAA